MKKNFFIFFATCFILAAFAACGSEAVDTAAPAAVPTTPASVK